MDELVAAIRAALDEDEQLALAATPGRWEAGPKWGPLDHVHAPDYRREGFSQGQHVAECIQAEGGMGPWAAYVQGSGFPIGNARHIARHDPARVLRQVAAHRKLIDEILKYEAKIDGEWGCCHSADQIGQGQCPDTKPSEITALLALAEAYGIEVSNEEAAR